MKTVLITGATGFIGQQCFLKLIDEGFEVHALSRRDQQGDLLKGHWHQADIMDFPRVRAILQLLRPEYLLHLAWVMEPKVFWTSSENISFVSASLHLLHAFAENGGRRATFAGTCAEYAWNELQCVENHSALRPASLYGTCKNALREIVEKFAQDKGLSWAWGRIFYVYGPGESSVRFVAHVISSLLEGDPVQGYAGGQIRDFLHVEDVGSAFAQLLASKVCGAVNVASGDPVSIDSLVEIISRKLGRSKQTSGVTLSSGPLSLTASNTRLRDEVGWRPRFTLDSGLDNTIAWWKRELLLGKF